MRTRWFVSAHRNSLLLSCENAPITWGESIVKRLFLGCGMLAVLLAGCSGGGGATEEMENPSPPSSVAPPSPTRETGPTGGPARVLTLDEAGKIYFDAACAASPYVRMVYRLVNRDVADKYFDADMRFPAIRQGATDAVGNFYEVLTSPDYEWPDSVREQVRERAVAQRVYTARFEGLLNASRAGLSVAVKLINDSQRLNDDVAAPLREALNLPPTSECPDPESPLRYEIYCGTGDSAVRYTDFAQAWPDAWESDDCEGIWIDDDFSDEDQRLIEIHTSKPFSQAKEKARMSALQYALASCAANDKSEYKYLRVDILDRAISTRLPKSVFILCPDHPLADQVTTDISRIEEQSEGGRPAFGDGLHRVGVDIRPGTYRSEGNSGGCYWERINSVGQTIANDFSNGSSIQFTVYPSDFEVRVDFCNTFMRVG